MMQTASNELESTELDELEIFVDCRHRQTTEQAASDVFFPVICHLVKYNNKSSPYCLS